MRQFLSALMKEGVLSIVMLLLLLLLVWGIAWFLRADNPDWMNLPVLISIALVGAWAMMFVAQKVMAVKNAMRIEAQLKAQSGAQLAGASADKKGEIEAMRKKFDESLEALKRTKGGKSALFTLPWYVIIGPPGSGKTTALQESGLNFPASQGGAKVKGIGGTRNCDWWFTADGILLDTAGRYTTVAEDHEEWFSFLELIRTGRKQKPINGTIVAIPVDELMQATGAEIDKMAKDVRDRIDELSARLQAVFPVYMMFTKCDLVAGFVEFFEDYSKDERNQVWGFTFPYSLPDRQYTDLFDEECDRMTSNLQRRQLELLAAERPPAKKQSIYLFPRQFQLARAKMREFIQSLFGATAFQEAAVLRGIYFTSGTQKGTPIDQILARMGAAMGMSMGSDGADERVEKKSFFINQLFSTIIFGDKTLARSSSKVIRKRRAWRLAVQTLSLAALAVVGWGSVEAFFKNRGAVNDVEAASLALKEAPATNAEADLVKQLEAMDVLRKQLQEKDPVDGKFHTGLHWGMGQSGKMFNAGSKVYFQALKPRFIDPCRKRLEDELKSTVADLGNREKRPTRDEYQALLDVWRVYRMLGGELQPNAPLIQNILKKKQRWTGPLTGSMNAGTIETLAGEQLEFFANQLARTSAESDPFGLRIQADGQIVRQTVDLLKGGWWYEAAYNDIIQNLARRLPAPTLADLAGANSDFLEFKPKAGQEELLSRAGVFTNEGWKDHVKPLIEQRTSELVEMFKELNSDRSPDTVRSELEALYKADQARVWEWYMDAVQPKAVLFRNVNDGRDSIKKLSGKDSPYQRLIPAVWNLRAIEYAPGVRVEGPTEDERKAVTTALGLIATFAESFDKFGAETGVGKRFTDTTRTTETSAALKKLAADFRTANTEVPKPFAPRDERAAAALLRVMGAANSALRAECAADVASLYKSEVLDFWNTKGANSFPFETTNKDQKSVKMADFSALFNPVNGNIPRVHRHLKEISGVMFNEVALLTFGSEYTDMIAAAEKITQAMFHDDKAELMSVQGEVKLEKQGLMTDAELELGTLADGNKQILKPTTAFSGIQKFTWAQYASANTSLGAQMRAFYGEKRRPTDELIKMKENFGSLSDEWSFLRLLWNDTSRWAHKTDGKARYEFSMIFEGLDGQQFVLKGTIFPAKPITPYDRDIFRKFKVAQKVEALSK